MVVNVDSAASLYPSDATGESLTDGRLKQTNKSASKTSSKSLLLTKAMNEKTIEDGHKDKVTNDGSPRDNCND